MTHPNNPAGSTITEKELYEVIEIVEKHNICLLFDETYRDLSFKRALPPAATLSPNGTSITSMSKVYSLPGIELDGLVRTKT